MFEILLALVLTCLGSLVLGQAVMALCGSREWSWLAAPVGLATMILLAVPAIHVPGRALTTAVITAVLMIAGLALWVRRPAQRPPLADLAAGLPVMLLVLVPFVASGRAGTLGVSFDNDMAGHLLLAEAYRFQAVAKVAPLLPEYPLGPHALAATLAEGLGIRTDLAFAGLTAAGPVLLAWTVLASLRGVKWAGRAMAATVVGIPFLIAGLYGEGAFKEIFEAMFVLAVALMLGGFQPSLGRWRWVPMALVLAGAASVYSLQGLLWPVLFVALWLAGRTAACAWRSGVREAWSELRSELIPGALGLTVLVLVLLPQIPRLEKFVSKTSTKGIARTNLGNLVGQLSGWESLGVWNNPDFRFPPVSAFSAGMWTAFVLALVILGVTWSLRQGQWMLPVAAASAIFVWDYTVHTQSPYVAAKALVIASPLLLLLAVRPLVHRNLGAPMWWRVAASMLAAVLLLRVVDSSWEALRISKVGDTSHLVELRSLRPLLGNQQTLFLGNDDFIQWELAGSRVTPAYLGGALEIPLQPNKKFSYGQPLDFDSVTAATLNSFDWVITTRDMAGSMPPPQMHLAQLTHDYALWQRIGQVMPHGILAEGPGAAKTLNCKVTAGRHLAHERGIAVVRKPSSEVAVPDIAPGGSITVTLRLTPGTWDLETPYQSPLPIRVTTLALRATLPANLDRSGPRWPIGQIVVSRAENVAITLHVLRYWLTPNADIAVPVSIIATPVGTTHTIALGSACEKLVDWYQSF